MPASTVADLIADTLVEAAVSVPSACSVIDGSLRTSASAMFTWPERISVAALTTEIGAVESRACRGIGFRAGLHAGVPAHRCADLCRQPVAPVCDAEDRLAVQPAEQPGRGGRVGRGSIRAGVGT